MNDIVQYIRKDARVFPVFHDNGKIWAQKDGEMVFPSISKAKHWSRSQPLGTVRRYQSLEREHGKQFMKELFK